MSKLFDVSGFEDVVMVYRVGNGSSPTESFPCDLFMKCAEVVPGCYVKSVEGCCSMAHPHDV
jgi:hypothetical protein